jgi:hypothetical protein
MLDVIERTHSELNSAVSFYIIVLYQQAMIQRTAAINVTSRVRTNLVVISVCSVDRIFRGSTDSHVETISLIFLPHFLAWNRGLSDTASVVAVTSKRLEAEDTENQKYEAQEDDYVHKTD